MTIYEICRSVEINDYKYFKQLLKNATVYYPLKFRKNFTGDILNKGNSYSNYNPNLITGGGFATKSDDVVFRIANRFPNRVDCGLSRYVFIRLNDTFLGESR